MSMFGDAKLSYLLMLIQNSLGVISSPTAVTHVVILLYLFV